MAIKIQNSKNAQIRFLKEMKNVLYNQKRKKITENFPVYYIWRGVKYEKNLRYDITIIPPRFFDDEFVKTKGHYHIGNYGELYKILQGEGIFLLQKKGDENDKKIENAYYIRGKKGDFILVPPHYGHTIINSSAKKIFKMANWISEKCKPDYKSIEKSGGFCYYYTLNGWVKNKKCESVPKLKQKRPLKSFPKNLDFLYGN